MVASVTRVLGAKITHHLVLAYGSDQSYFTRSQRHMASRVSISDDICGTAGLMQGPLIL